MTINERLKILRKNFKLTQSEFGSKLGVTKSNISVIEKGSTRVTDRMVNDLCREFNVNEKWLREGIEPIFKEENDDSLEEYLNKKGCTDLEKKAIKKFMDVYRDIPEEQRDEFLESFTKMIKIAFNVPHNSFDNFNKNKD